MPSRKNNRAASSPAVTTAPPPAARVAPLSPKNATGPAVAGEDEGVASRRDNVIAVLCALATLAVLLALRPLAGAPQNDDFSYARTAWAFAQTGRIVYNGWASPLLLPQIAIGAIALKLAGGFSYAPLALIGVASACGAAAVFYRLARACGLSVFLSVLAVTILTCNPIFLGVAPTFMTDAPSLLLFLLALYYFASSLRPGANNGVSLAARPFYISVVFALIGGMNRQIIWVAELGALAFLFFAVRGENRGDQQRVVIGAGVLLTVGGALSLWFARQPYTVAPAVVAGLALARNVPLLSVLYIYKLLNLLALGLAPALLLALGRRRPYRLLLVGALGVLAFALAFVPVLIAGPGVLQSVDPVNPLAAWLRLTIYGQYFTSHGALVGGVHGFDTRPPAWGGDLSRLLVLFGALCLTASGALFFSWWDNPNRAAAETTSAPRSNLETVHRARVSAVACASVAQIIVSLPWYANMTVLDRYLLLLWPGLLLLHLAQTGGQDRTLPRPLVAAAVAVTVVWSGWGIASSQEYFAYTRARAALYNRLVSRGVPRAEIDGGFEWNADTQVAADGYVNNDQIKNPPGAFRSDARGGVTYQPRLFPSLDAKYLLSTEAAPPPKLVESAVPDDTETYASLLPPARRAMYVYRLRRDATSPNGAEATPAP